MLTICSGVFIWFPNNNSWQHCVSHINAKEKAHWTERRESQQKSSENPMISKANQTKSCVSMHFRIYTFVVTSYNN